MIEAFKINKFDLIGNSMSGLLVQNIALNSFKVRRVVCITPVIAEGARIAKEAIPFVEETIKVNEQNTIVMLQGMTKINIKKNY